MRRAAELAKDKNGKISMPPESKPEFDKELADIKREVIEGRNLVIKADNLLKNLHAELKLVSKRQDDFQRKTWLSSGVAYAIFASLAIAGAMAVSSARVHAAGADKERLEKVISELNTQLEKEKAENGAMVLASRQANEVYRMMTTLPGDERLKGIDAYLKMETAKLTPLEKIALRDRADLLRKEVGQAAFERGKQAFRRNDMKTAAEELTRFRGMNPPADEAMDAAFFLGVAHNHLKQHDQAIQLLSNFVSGDKRSKSRDYAMLMLASSYEQTGQFQKAIDTARDALGTYPNTDFGPQLRSRLAASKRGLAASSAGGAPAAAAPAPTAPAAAAPAGGSAPAPAQPAPTNATANAPAGQ